MKFQKKSNSSTHKVISHVVTVLLSATLVSVSLTGVAETNAGKITSTAKPALVKSITTTPIAARPENPPNPAELNKVVSTSDAFANANGVRVLLVPEKETTISSTIAAKIVQFNGTLGQTFSAGDVLVAFDCDEALARVEMSKAELSSAIDQHEAKVKMQGLDQASDVEVSMAASAVNKAKAQLSLNKTQVNQCKIFAPWSGRVAKTNVKNFMTVTPGQPLMELVNSGPLKLKLNAPSKLLGKIKRGTKFKVNIDETGQSYDAVVSAINSRIDSVSQTVELEARMSKNYKELLPGMSGVADFGDISH